MGAPAKLPEARKGRANIGRPILVPDVPTNVRMPRPLDGSALAHWSRLLGCCAWLQQSDADLLAMYCQGLQEQEALRDKVMQEQKPADRAGLRRLTEELQNLARMLALPTAQRLTAGMQSAPAEPRSALEDLRAKRKH